MKTLAFLALIIIASALILPIAGCTSEADKHLKAGVEFQNRWQPKEAIAEFDEAIRLNPDYTKAYHNRGLAYFDLGQLERAIQDYDEAIYLYPVYAEAYYNRGLAYRLLGKKTEAITNFKVFITLTENPEWIEMVSQQIEELSK
jgi:tetratricopeptide (TPR) repeat protein